MGHGGFRLLEHDENYIYLGCWTSVAPAVMAALGLLSCGWFRIEISEHFNELP
jgi:hypothetical protein